MHNEKIMSKKKTIPSEEEQLSFKEGAKFLKELREMPYDNSRIGQSFIVVNQKFVEKGKNEANDQKKENQPKQK